MHYRWEFQSEDSDSHLVFNAQTDQARMEVIVHMKEGRAAVSLPLDAIKPMSDALLAVRELADPEMNYGEE